MKDIYILGINPTTKYFSSHDPSACLLKNGKIIAAAEEERFTRIKHSLRTFPTNAIKYCLDYANVNQDDVIVSLPADPNMCEVHFKKNPLGIYHSLKIFKRQGFKNGKKIADEIAKDIPLNSEIDFVSHHKAHAASTYYCSGFKEASVITIDALGELGLGETTVLWKGNNTLTKIKNYLFPNSLGLFYELIGVYLGFDTLDGQGKVMGLSSYGKNTFKIKNITNLMSRIQIRRTFGKPRKKSDALTEKSRNIAYVTQKKIEEVAVKLVNENYENTNSKNLCLAGGVAMNCVMNGKLLRSENVENIFIQPAAGDSGLAIGTALETYKKLGYNPHTEFKHNYLGPEFSNEEIKESLDKFNLKYDFYDDIAGITAELLAKDKLIGWFQGRMELGARALGNRSILANPCNPKMKDILNLKVKHRENFRPFCPSILDKAHKEYVENPYPSPYMILAFDVKKEKRKEIPAVVHVDGTARTQTVSKETNPLYYKLIENFESITGIPVVLNTSFNVAGEPIVCKPIEAINDLIKTKLDYLAIGNYLIRKRSTTNA